jgi:uncharacterized Ntn-hydrolase superfamily protein
VTYSLVARCARTGAVGVATATADIAVGARVPHAAAGVGAVATQHRTDPRLGPLGLRLLADGCSAADVVAAIAAEAPHVAWRQLAVVDAAGRTAAFSGELVTTVGCEHHAPGCVAVGNCLRTAEVGPAMTAAFADAPGEPLAERLVRALEAGLAAGGETSPARSAALLVARDPDMALVDLRADDDAEPIVALRGLWDAYRGWVADFRLRALDPDAARGVADGGPGDGDLP